ncbi:MAG: EAL domain-containing protein [Sulfuricurvum sp.]|nr:EAL domain-containing protein [Sulfuricurvum sp.]
MDKVRIRATLLAMGIVLILVGYFVYSILQDKKRVLDEKTQAHRQLLRNAFELSVLDTEKGLNHFACKMMADHRIVDAFETRDRDTLYRLALPYFNDAKLRGDVDLTGFIHNDGFHFLRMQEPKKFGDNITKKRPMLAEAIRIRKPITSLDVTKYNISLVSIIPVFKEERFIGIIQASAKIQRIQERLNAHSAIRSAIAFDTKALKQMLPNYQSKTYGSYSLISSNDSLFEQLPQNYAFMDSIRYTYLSKTYIIASRELVTYAHKPLAQMICALDITDDELAYEKEFNNILFISTLLLLLLVIILHIGFKKLINKISSLSSQLTQQLDVQIHHDTLTGLPNRKALLENIEQKKYVAVLLLNIDNFRETNDLYGHEIGDKILQEVAKSIERIIENYSLHLYKMHSDEYALALTQYIKVEDFNTMCQTILDRLHSLSNEIDGITIFITFSMGADICFDEGCDLVGRADMALKTAKKRGYTFVKYHDSLQIKEEYHNNIHWSKKLKEAINNNRFELYYQGIHDAKTQNIYEYEALIRIIDEDGTVVSPGQFLEIAKKSRLYVHITDFVINAIFKQLMETPHQYSINLSIDDILDPKIQSKIYELLAEYPVGDRLIFELLEGEGIENYQEVLAFILRVKEFGCKIAIDDFGTGYSNFAHIMKLNVDFIKIDGSLIKRLDLDLSAQDIVRTIVEFAHRLNIKTVAEFVSTKDIYDECIELNIDYIQGYYLSEPIPL